MLVTNARQYGLLAQAKAALDEVITALQNEVPLDLVQIDMTTAWEKMGEVVGENAPDELITQLFSQFCLGK